MNNFTNVQLNELSDTTHARNAEAGWWTNISTGESTLKTRNRPEILMLIVSEVSEAYAGMVDDLMDDKLPHLPMFNVEIADVAIRLLDVIGAERQRYDVTPTVDYDHDFAEAVQTLRSVKQDMYWFTLLVNHMSSAMEHLRKSRITEYRFELARALATTFAVAHVYKFDLLSVINEKVEFNAHRADHKIANRLASDGKKF